MAQEWVEIQRTEGSTLKQLWIRLPSGLWMPTERFKVDAQMMPPIMGGSPDTIDKQVGASADDRTAKDDDTWEAANSTLLRVHRYTEGNALRRHVGCRFTGLDLSQGATIDVAYASVYVTSYDDPYCDIYCEDQASPLDFGDGTLVQDRVRTTASTQWAADNIGTGNWKNTPPLVNPIQEIVTDYTVNILVLLFIAKIGSSKRIYFRSYDYSGNAHGPKLHIEYTAGAAYYHGLRVQGEGELALCDVGNHPLRIRKGGTTYGIELVAVDDPNASRVRIKTSAGIKAIRKYT